MSTNSRVAVLGKKKKKILKVFLFVGFLPLLLIFLVLYLHICFWLASRIEPKNTDHFFVIRLYSTSLLQLILNSTKLTSRLTSTDANYNAFFDDQSSVVEKFEYMTRDYVSSNSIGAQRVKNACGAFRNFCEEKTLDG